MATTVTNAADLIEPLKRAVAAPGGYDDAFPNGDDDTLFAYITDAFSEARMDRNPSLTGTVDWVDGTFDPILTQGEAYLVVVYAAINILSNVLRNQSTANTYKAGTVEYSTEYSANVIKGALDSLNARRAEILRRSMNNPAWFGDAYWGRMTNGVQQSPAGWSLWPEWGFYQYPMGW